MIGAVMIPINARLVESEVKFILQHSGAKILVTSDEYLKVVENIRHELADLQFVLSTNGPSRNVLAFGELLKNTPTPTPVEIDGTKRILPSSSIHPGRRALLRAVWLPTHTS